MSVRHRRVAVAGVAAAAAVAVPAAALAASWPSGKPTPSPSAASKSAAAASEPRVDRSLTGPVAVAALAGGLDVSHSAAQRALAQIGALSRQDGADPTGPAFAAIARDLGVSPARLAAALRGVKQAVAGR